jgi:hypothetical protein
MKLLILGHNLNPKRRHIPYRGTYRSHPTYCRQVSEDHEVNQAFLWFCQEGGESGVIHDLNRAKSLIRTYHQISPPQEFDLVQVLEPGDSPVSGSEQLGYDLTKGYSFSLLSWGLDFSSTHLDRPRESLKHLLKLLSEHFRPKLNTFGLFDTASEAQFCLACMMALQDCYPALWEDSSSVFEVKRLFLVPV